MQWQVCHEWLPIVVVADEGRERVFAHQLHGNSNIVALELCWYIHGGHFAGTKVREIIGGQGPRGYFLVRGFCALDLVLEPQCLAMAAWNSVMDGDPKAWGRFRASGKPVTGLSRADLSTRLIVPCPSAAIDTEC